MKNRALIIAVLIAVSTAFSIVPSAKAEPLTIMAIVGLVTVLSVSSIDTIASNHADDRDSRARNDQNENTLAKAEAAADAREDSEVRAAVRPN